MLKRSNIWNLGTYVPENVIEYSIQKQPQITCLDTITLEEIVIDEVDCGGIQQSLVNGDLLPNKVLELSPGSTQQLFSSLKVLTLCGISLKSGCYCVPSVFSFK